VKNIIFVTIFSLFTFCASNAKDIDVQYEISQVFSCKIEKQLIKNKEYNYKTFLPNEIKSKDIKALKVSSNFPSSLSIKGLSNFFNNQKNYKVKIVNKDIILFKAFSDDGNYSESAILTNDSGELIHEKTNNLKSESFDKEITFYICQKSKLDT
jgi:hypothetical protein